MFKTEITNRRRAQALAILTEDAYSFGLHYRRGEWTKIAEQLLDQGYSQDEVEWILRSKHMRWAADSELTGTQRWMTAELFQDYLVNFAERNHFGRHINELRAGKEPQR